VWTGDDAPEQDLAVFVFGLRVVIFDPNHDDPHRIGRLECCDAINANRNDEVEAIVLIAEPTVPHSLSPAGGCMQMRGREATLTTKTNLLRKLGVIEELLDLFIQRKPAKFTPGFFCPTHMTWLGTVSTLGVGPPEKLMIVDTNVNCSAFSKPLSLDSCM
jgi:hypothetical protein